MVNLQIFAVGKIRESYFEAGIAEYVKRLGKYVKLEIVAVEDEPIPTEANVAQKAAVLACEGERILAKLPKDAFVITLEIEGKSIDSVGLSQLIEKVSTYETGKLSFVIGGSLGLADIVKARSNFALSLSSLTFPHQLVRLMLLEQLYRAFSILNHSNYHK